MSSHYYHIAFNTIIADRIKDITNKEAVIVPHGLISISYKKSDNILNALQLKPKKYVLSPTKSYGDMNVEVMESICNSVELNSFLKQNEMKMILRSPVQISNDYIDNYVFALDFLSYDAYYNLLSNSYALILCLNEESYCYRVSAVLFECMKLNLPIYVYSNRILEFYGKYMNGKMAFETTKDLLELLLASKVCPWRDSIMEISNPAEAWQKVLNCSNASNFNKPE